ncbi:MAG: hypothetical protein C4570_07735 [Ammonifex sp.]|nr:MAG: hypothetical protein C4570_07735 [Ammonifex sp.]
MQVLLGILVQKRFLALVILVLIAVGLGCTSLTDSPVTPGGSQVRNIETREVPDLKLPFSRDELNQAWIIGFIENAKFEGVEDGKIVFVAKGDGDCGDFSFPYRLVYDPESGVPARREALFIPAGQGVAFGTAGAWQQVLLLVEPRHTELAFGFKPQKGQVLAGATRGR